LLLHRLASTTTRPSADLHEIPGISTRGGLSKGQGTRETQLAEERF
jgi:hypothetical protein